MGFFLNKTGRPILYNCKASKWRDATHTKIVSPYGYLDRLTSIAYIQNLKYYLI